MIIIAPHTITDSMLTSSTAYEVAPSAYAGGTTYATGTDVSVAGTAGLVTVYRSLQDSNAGHSPASSPTWWAELCELYSPYNAGTTYALGDRCQDNTNHLIYESLAAGNVGNALTDDTKWVEVQATNRWSMFDQKVGTQTYQDISPLTVVLRPGIPVDGLPLLELTGQSVTVTVKNGPGGDTVYTNTSSIDGSIITCFYDFFFAPYSQGSDIALIDLPGHFYDPEITITVSSSSGAVGIGVCKPGSIYDMSNTLSGASVGVIDYSKKETDTWGNVAITEGKWAKTSSVQTMIPKHMFNLVFRALADAPKPSAFVGSDGQIGFDPLIIYGFFRDFKIAIEYPKYYLCNLEIEGII